MLNKLALIYKRFTLTNHVTAFVLTQLKSCSFGNSRCIPLLPPLILSKNKGFPYASLRNIRLHYVQLK